MPRKSKKQKKDITVHSDETKIFFGIILALFGLGIALSPFLDAQLFRFFTELTGFASIPIGATIMYLSFRMFTKIQKLTSWKIQIGLLLFSIFFAAFLTFWIPDDILTPTYDYSTSAGLLGYVLHLQLVAFMGRLLEIITLLVLLVVSVSLITDIKLGQIKNFFAEIFSKGDIDPESVENMEDRLSMDSEPVINLKSGRDDSDFNSFEEVKISNANNHEQYQFEESRVVKTQSDHESVDVSEPQYPDWQLPSIDLLQDPQYKPQDEKVYRRNALIIEKTLASFGITGKVAEISVGPSVVQYALSINVGTRASKVNNLTDDLALALSVPSSSIRMEIPIPGTSYIGIEAENPIKNFVYPKELLVQLKKNIDNYTLPLMLGKSVTGKYIISDLTKLPHLLVAGATGTGKSVGINSILLGLLMTKTPDEIGFILVDPKMVELAPYNGIPHLLIPVITDMDLVLNALQWAVEEMHRRYLLLKQLGVRNIKEYNKSMGYTAMKFIIIVIDEMADLMLQKGVDIETKIVRLAQMARAVGIHLILATQRPSVNVITGLIKANIPARIAFTVATAIDSRVVIDQIGAETLIGNGDLLFKDPTQQKPIRIQGAFTEIKDLEGVIKLIKQQSGSVAYKNEIIETKVETIHNGEGGDIETDDPVFRDALQVVINAQKASTSFLQRKLKIGYNRAARIIDQMEEMGAISPSDGSSSARRVLITSPDQIIGKK